MFPEMVSRFLAAFLSIFLATLPAFAAPGDIVFVTQVPFPADFATVNSTFGNQSAALDAAPRGGDLYIRYADGTMKNLTAAAGLGQSGQQGNSAVAVRDPCVHWGGAKVLFSMVRGAPQQQYQLIDARWQLYEITNLGKDQTPVVTKVPNQPEAYNNVMGCYLSDDAIVFASDRPRGGEAHLYPQHDEYESTPTNSGLWKLTPQGILTLLDHSPSGDFHPTVDSFGRVIFTRWDHLQRDQQSDAGVYGTFDFDGEGPESAPTSLEVELFPEPRDTDDDDFDPRFERHTFNQFFPWMMNQDGTDVETLNHVGRQEIGGFGERSRTDDPNLTYIGSGGERTESDAFHQLRESPTIPGRYYAIKAPEFSTHAAGQIIYLDGAPSKNPDDMRVVYVTHPETSSYSDNASADHTGLYRNPLPLANGSLIAVHTSSTREDRNDGTTELPQSRYAFRIVSLVESGGYLRAGAPLTGGIRKTVRFWSPDVLVRYENTEMWELQPVELVARARPPLTAHAVPSIETALLAEEGVELSALREFLAARDLALIVSRNVTTRDAGDEQQPFNLRVAGTQTQTIGAGGRLYDVSLLQIFQGDLIRGIDGSSDPRPGRRVLARPLHDLIVDNPDSGSAIPGTVALGNDGSMAAFVPARRAVSWQLLAPDGEPIVRERYWLTFQPGEVRVCASCHGVNRVNQAGNEAPTNPPDALRRILAVYRGAPPLPPGGGSPAFSMALKAKGRPATRLKPGSRYQIVLSRTGTDGANRLLQVRATYRKCTKVVDVRMNGAGELTLRGALPRNATAGKVRFELGSGSSTVSRASLTVQSRLRSAGKLRRCGGLARP